MRKIIAGIDIGNSSTETALAVFGEDSVMQECVSGIAPTTGIKGTGENYHGMINSLNDAIRKLDIDISDIDLIRINEATPVIGSFAMETITETVITESTLIGHNPDTPGGIGIGTGISVMIDKLSEINDDEDYIVVVPGDYGFEETARVIQKALDAGVSIRGAILKNDDAVLVSNRIDSNIPIIDEVESIEKVPLGMPTAVEVAEEGKCIDHLANPYGIATVFDLDAEKTRQVIHIAKALIGSRSAVVVKTPEGDVRERRIPAGEIIICGEYREHTVSVDSGAEAIMETVEKARDIIDIRGSQGTNVGGMLEKVRLSMAQLTEQEPSTIQIKDLMAVDTIMPKKIAGSIANESAMERAIGIASMVKTNRLHMEHLASLLEEKLNIKTEIGGVEGDMAALGALTTPGTGKPLLVVDIGAGSTDTCFMDEKGCTRTVHLAGAGNMTTMVINAELGLDDMTLAEDIKKYPLAKVESLYQIRYEDGGVRFLNEPVEPVYYGRTVIMRPEGWIPVPGNHTIDHIVRVRKNAKKKVLVTNVLRVLKKASVTGSISEFHHAVLVGGSSLDFELGNMLTEALSYYGVVCGKANVRKTEGPRNAVATGLIMSYCNEMGSGGSE